MHQDVTQPLWRFRDGIVVLATAMAAYTALSWAHMALVSETVGMEAYLGSGDRLRSKSSSSVSSARRSRFWACSGGWDFCSRGSTGVRWD